MASFCMRRDASAYIPTHRKRCLDRFGLSNVQLTDSGHKRIHAKNELVHLYIGNRSQWIIHVFVLGAGSFQPVTPDKPADSPKLYLAIPESR